jgi:hypothetical protein
MKSTICLTILLAGCLTLSSGCTTTQSGTPAVPSRIRAHQVISVADDFVVDVYHNGVRVPDTKRKPLLDRFGATAESTAIEVQKGDWLVFHVVNNRLRWDGAYYFGVAGVIAPGEFGFVSELASGIWSVCDSPASAGQFIAQKDFMSDNRAVPVERPWHEGTGLMKRYAGETWDGVPVWGRERSTWIKVRVP